MSQQHCCILVMFQQRDLVLHAIFDKSASRPNWILHLVKCQLEISNRQRKKPASWSILKKLSECFILSASGKLLHRVHSKRDQSILQGSEGASRVQDGSAHHQSQTYQPKPRYECHSRAVQGASVHKGPLHDRWPLCITGGASVSQVASGVRTNMGMMQPATHGCQSSEGLLLVVTKPDFKVQISGKHSMGSDS